jgi:hypothetical protein
VKALKLVGSNIFVVFALSESPMFQKCVGED